MLMKSKPNELAISRIYDAPLKAVWDAWTDPEQVAQWWGPRGFTLTTHSKELKPGGTWNYTMHGPDGTDYPNTTLYHEVEPYSRLVYDHGGYEDKPPLFRVTVTFEEINQQTHMHMIMTMPSAEATAHVKQVIKDASGNSTWDKLAEYLAKQQSKQEIFVINRSFATSLDTMFEMWSNPKHFAQWMGPTGASMEFMHVDVREGGSSFYKMTGVNDLVMYGKVHYHKIQKPDYLEYTQQFADEQGNVARHPLAPAWPETMSTKVFLCAEDEAQTRVTLVWQPVGKVSAQELQAFIKMKSGMTQGWSGSFDKLEEYLAA